MIGTGFVLHDKLGPCLLGLGRGRETAKGFPTASAKGRMRAIHDPFMAFEIHHGTWGPVGLKS